MSSRHPHILIFDSGVGGLSVVAEIRQLLPSVRLTYLGDTAFLPYGSKEEQVLIERVAGLVGSMVERLAPDLVVIACNTASTVCLPRLRAALRVPIVGVVPAIKPAALLSRRRVIGLLGTAGTVRRRYTQNLIEAFAPDCRVIRVGSPALVMMAEAALAGRMPDPAHIRQELLPFCGGAPSDQPDIIVLACTHFPLIRDDLAQAIPSDVRFVDSGRAIAMRVQELLAIPQGGDDGGHGHAAFVTNGGGMIPEQRGAFIRLGFTGIQCVDFDGVGAGLSGVSSIMP